VSNPSEKLEQLARQVRALALETSDRKRAEALRVLAVLYTKQAEEITGNNLFKASRRSRLDRLSAVFEACAPRWSESPLLVETCTLKITILAFDCVL
jgi:hypothetical protein